MKDICLEVPRGVPDSPRMATFMEWINQGKRDGSHITQDAALGKLFRIWLWEEENRPELEAVGVSSEWVDQYLGCPGFAGAMEMAGWVCLAEAGAIFCFRADQRAARSNPNGR